MKLKIFGLIIIFSYFTIHYTRAAQYYVDHITIEDGLSHNCVNAIIQDSMGFIWFGTRDGLNRFDGTAFKVFRNDFSGSGLENNFITALYEDIERRIWIGTDMGLYIYNPDTEKIVKFDKKSDDGESIIRTVTGIKGNKTGKIYISEQRKGLFEYDIYTGNLCHYPMSEYGEVRDFTIDDNGRIWMAFWRGLYYKEPDEDMVLPYVLRNGDAPFKNMAVSELCVDEFSRVLYIGFEKEGDVLKLDFESSEIEHLMLEEEGKRLFVRTIIQYDANYLWVGTESGVYVYCKSTGTFKRLFRRAFDPYSLSDNAVYSICRDRNGGVWIGTFFGGVNYCSERNSRFDKYYPSIEKGALQGYRVREMVGGNENEMWVGTEDAGLFRFDENTGKFDHFGPSRDFPNIHGLCMDGKYLWVGTFSYGLMLIDTETMSVKSFHAEDRPLTIRDNYVFSIYKPENRDLVYFGTANYLVKYDWNTGKFSRVPELDGNLIYDIKEDSSGNMWIATYSNGVFCYDRKSDIWHHYFHSESGGSLPTDKVISVFEDSSDRLWIATQGGGVCLFMPENNTFRSFNTLSGMPSDVVFRIEEDESGVLWMSTGNGLVEFDPLACRPVKVYTSEDGLLHGQFNYKSSWRDAKGKMYFGMTSGLVSFSRSDIVCSNFDGGPLYITGFSILGQSVPVGVGSPLKKSITKTDRLVLRHNQNTFAFNVSTLDYGDCGNVCPMYMMKGVDEEWKPVSDNWKIEYSYLPYGKYTLYLQTGNTMSGETKLDIVITPPFWLSYWAYFLYVLVLCAAAVLLWRYYMKKNNIRRQLALDKFRQDHEKELYEAKIKFFIYITHELRTPVTLVKGPLDDIMARQNMSYDELMEDLGVMRKNVDRLYSLTGQLLDFKDMDSPEKYALNYSRVSIPNLLNDIFQRFTTLARQQNFDYSLDIAESCNGLYAEVDSDAFMKIISNLVSNAFKYGDDYVKIRLHTPEDDKFCVVVENGGNRIPDSKEEEIFKLFIRLPSERNEQGIGIGLPIARFFAEAHGGELNVSTSVGKTDFVLTLPIRNKHVDDSGQEEKEEERSETFMIDGKNFVRGRKTVLIVEDNRDLRKFLMKGIINKYNVFYAANGEEGTAILKKHNIDVIVSDIMMPVKDGITFCREVKSDLEFCHIPVILLTAKAKEQSRLDGIEAGADSYIEKPFSMDYLMALISNSIENRERLKSIFAKCPIDDMSEVTTDMTNSDEQFIENVHKVIRANLSDPHLTMTAVAEKLCMSKSGFYRKLQGLLDLSPREYLKIERLKEAASLLKSGNYQVGEVCYMVGFNSMSYFSKCFYEQYGAHPKDYINAT